jgi:hypothetical protein
MLTFACRSPYLDAGVWPRGEQSVSRFRSINTAFGIPP